MKRWWKDIQFACRIWRKIPSIAVPVLSILALGIGANTAIFSVVDAIWMRPLPIRDPHGLLKIASYRITGTNPDRPLSYPEMEDIQAGVPALASIAISSRRAVILRTKQDTALISAAVISPDYFSTLGVRARLGNLSIGNGLDYKPGVPIVALSFEAWRKYFVEDANIVGRTVTLNTTRCTIAAVLPPEFRGTDPYASPAIWIPLGTWIQINPGERSNVANREFWDWDAFARLVPGASLREAQKQFDALSQRIASTAPAQEQGRSLGVARNDEIKDPRLRTLGRILSILAILVLLIAGVDVSVLLLAFGQRRRRELATRIACGATRRRLLCQLGTENGLLAAAGCILALLVGYGLIELLPAMLPSSAIPVGLDFHLDGRVLSCTLGLSIVTTMGCGLIPALKAVRFDLVSAIKEGSNGTSSALRFRTRNFMVVAQIAASVVLLVVAGLLFRSMIKIQTVDLGFDRNKQLVLVDLSLGMTNYDQDSVQKYYHHLEAALEQTPGVDQIALARRVPLSPSGLRAAKTVYFSNADANTPDGVRIGYTSVGPSYFSLMGTRLMQGREFSPQDTLQSPKVAVINETAARRFFSHGNALGQRLLIGKRASAPYEIVGIVEDGKYADITEEPQPFLFLALLQEPSADLTVIAATKGSSERLTNSVRRQVRNVDPQVPVLDTRTLREHINFATYTRRMTTGLVMALTLLGLVLAMTGLYGLMNYVVQARRHEIGVRVALGGQATDVVWLVLRYAAAICLTGLTGGILLALAGERAVSALLFGVSGADPVTFVVVSLVFSTVALTATAIPLRAALCVDPLQVLRHE